MLPLSPSLDLFYIQSQVFSQINASASFTETCYSNVNYFTHVAARPENLHFTQPRLLQFRILIMVTTALRSWPLQYLLTEILNLFQQKQENIYLFTC